MTTKGHNEFEANMLAKIEEHGWFCMSVFDPEGKKPEFSYSIGFSKTLDAPEFIVMGLNNELRHSMMWEVFHQIKDGAVPAEEMRWSDLLEGHECASKETTHPQLFTEYATSADWFWKEQGRTGHPQVFRLVWPGAVNGLFPWDEGCSDDVIDDQSALWLPPV